ARAAHPARTPQHRVLDHRPGVRAAEPAAAGMDHPAGVFRPGVCPLRPGGLAPPAARARHRSLTPPGQHLLERIAMAAPASRRIGLIIVGDEILSGRRQDKHFAKVVELLGARGLQLARAEILPDDREVLTAALRRSFASGDIVLSCGGIGATPDDHTRQAAAVALGVPLELHPEAEQAITLRVAEMAAKGQGTADMSSAENQQRLQMGMFPAGCEIVPNPYNRIPGFYIRDHTFVPGFPIMAWPMLEWTLDTRYRDLHHRVAHAEHSFLAFGIPES